MERSQEKVEKASSKAKKTLKGKSSSEKLKGKFSEISTRKKNWFSNRSFLMRSFATRISFCWFCFPDQGDKPEKMESQISPEKTETQEIPEEFQKEYVAALDHEGKQTHS